MKILHIEDHFFPESGYQINLLARYMANKGHEIYIISSKPTKKRNDLNTFFSSDHSEADKKFENDYNVKIFRYRSLFKYSGRLWLFTNIQKKIRQIHPDIVFLHGNDTLTSMRVILRHNKNKIPLISDSHMLRMASRNRFAGVFRKFYRIFITPKIVRYKILVIRTQESDYVNRDLNIPKNLTPYISFGSDVNHFKYDKKIKKDFHSEFQIKEDSRILIYAGKIIKDKGIDILLRSLQKIDQSKLNLIMIGNIPDNDFGNELKELINSLKMRIFQYPTKTYKELAYYYKVADFAVFPKQSSLSFYDVQSAGLPVILEDNSINRKRINDYNGKLFKKDSPDDLATAISYYLNIDQDQLDIVSKTIRQNIVDNYDYSTITDRYLDVIKKTIISRSLHEN